jgi:hypothetical protein
MPFLIFFGVQRGLPLARQSYLFAKQKVALYSGYIYKPTKKLFCNQKNLPLECRMRREMGNAGMRPISAKSAGTIDRRCLRGSGCSPFFVCVWMFGLKNIRSSLRSRPLSPNPQRGRLDFLAFRTIPGVACFPVFSDCFYFGGTWNRSNAYKSWGSGGKAPCQKQIIPLKHSEKIYAFNVFL